MKRTEFIAISLESLEETGFFEENEVTFKEMRTIFNEELDKMHIGAEMEPLDEVDLDRILCLGIDKGTDNTLTSLHQKGLVSLNVNKDGDVAYQLTPAGAALKSTHNDLIKILKG